MTTTCLLLSFIVLSPSFFGISSVKSGPALLRVQEESSVEWVTPTLGNYREPKLADKYVRIEKWTNGTKVHYASHIWLNVPECRDIWANFTSWLPESSVIQQMNGSSTAFYQPFSEGNLEKYPKDNVTFINGRNSTCYTSYEHDDNYETYFPLQWAYPFDMQGATKTHVHLSSSVMTSWILGNLSTAEVLLLSLVADLMWDYSTGGIMFDELVALVAAGMDAPWIVVLYDVYTWASRLWDFYQLYTYAERAFWITWQVQERYGATGLTLFGPIGGDGWTWRGPFDEFSFGIPMPSSYVVSIGIWPPICQIRLGQRLDWYDGRGWLQSWGTEGIFNSSPGLYTTSWHIRTEYKAPRAAVGT